MVILAAAARSLPLLGQEQQGGNTHAAADQAYRSVTTKVKTPAQGADDIDLISCGHRGQDIGSPANDFKEQDKSAVGQDPVDGQGAAQQGIKQARDPDHDKLPRLGGPGNARGRNGQLDDLVSNPPGGTYGAFFLELCHGKVYNIKGSTLIIQQPATAAISVAARRIRWNPWP
jgi:hypothetical protein